MSTDEARPDRRIEGQDRDRRLAGRHGPDGGRSGRTVRAGGHPRQQHRPAAAVRRGNRAFAARHGHDGIRTNGLYLGLIETRRTAFIHDVPEAREQWLAESALDHVGQPEEAAAALFLVSDDASLITGAVRERPIRA